MHVLLTLVAIFAYPAFNHIPEPITSQRWVSVGGHLSEWHTHSWKNDPTSNGSKNRRRTTTTTHSKAIKQEQGGERCVTSKKGRKTREEDVNQTGKLLNINRTHLNNLINLFPGFMNQCGHCSETTPQRNCASYVINVLPQLRYVCGIYIDRDARFKGAPSQIRQKKRGQGMKSGLENTSIVRTRALGHHLFTHWSVWTLFRRLPETCVIMSRLYN